MKHLLTALALSVACLSPAAFAADAASAPMGKQQTKMAECNKDAADKSAANGGAPPEAKAHTPVTR